MAKKFRLTLFGGTGVTGRNAFRHLAAHVPDDMPWAIAGRNEQRLAELLSLAGECVSRPARVLADLEDPQSIEAMIKDTDVIIHLAGPYATHGEQFFEQCLKHRTHYVDIGGETFFIRRMIARYHDEAKRRGVILLPTAGYESVPFDLLTRLAVEHTRDHFDEGCRDVKIITSFHRTGSIRDNRISGGSLGTMRSILSSDTVDAFNDMTCLLPPDPENRKIQRRNRVRYQARFDQDVHQYTGPLQPAPFLNVPVVLRSAHLLGRSGLDYGSRLRYRDAMTMEFYSDTVEGQERAARRSARLNRLTSIAMAGPRVMRTLIRQRLDRMGIQPGNGPREDSLAAIDYELRLFATSEGGRCVRGSARATGHPGYLSTSKIVAEVGLYLCGQPYPASDVCGVVTPAVVLNSDFRDGLQRAGVSLRIDTD